MSEPIIATGKKVEDAIKNGLSELGLTLDEVKVEILSEGGFLKKAQVKLTPDEKLKVEVKETTIKIHTENSPKTSAVKEPKITVKAETKTDIKADVKAETKVEVKKAGKTSVKTTNKTEVKAETVDIKTNKEQTIKKENVINAAPKEFVEKLIKFIGSDAIVEETQDERTISLKITGEKMGQFIGNGGETLAAIQTITNVISGKNRAANKRVYVDAGNYKGGKDDRLKEIAEKMSKEVLETGESRKLKPMTAYERRVIHAYLQNMDGISTISKGEEPNRCLIIIPKY